MAENAADAGGVGWWATWTLMLIVLALIGIAVGGELAVAHPGDEATLGFTIFTFGGPAVPARPGLLPAQCAPVGSALPAAGTGGACDPCTRHRAAHA